MKFAIFLLCIAGAVFAHPQVVNRDFIGDVTSDFGDATSAVVGVFSTVTSGAVAGFDTATSAVVGEFTTLTSQAAGEFSTATSAV